MNDLKQDYRQLLHTLGVRNHAQAMAEIGRLHGMVLSAKEKPALPKQYAERDHLALDMQGGFYSKHVMAMTAEGLHAKSDIAGELAFRDAEICRLVDENILLRRVVSDAVEGFKEIERNNRNVTVTVVRGEGHADE